MFTISNTIADNGRMCRTPGPAHKGGCADPWSNPGVDAPIHPSIPPKVLSRIIRLIAETTRTPRTGMGKPERLKHLGGEVWSRRITEKTA